ncbi:MAG: hypothetical protein KGI68_04015 [Alphaproteobacteria bacterium]|nr:hypothetical protein [Alphaproteobacteria bacterium]MDE1987054.1 hypothetical protein [Alphaproteobacteria bacterium]MDE2163956.1 hypothetical protein [Alphaproteobacteria bacterium]MDE2264387.1 hypothetical protein [Alphaproteobacteria bacterium]MDE2500039.1 hypothetical protein [Alphaproteobacteria bacterium]
MIRVLNFCCVAAMGLTILALYHISEQTRIARVQLSQVEHRIADARTKTSVLQTEWVQVANPARIQQLAEASLGMSDTATLQLSSLELLPRRGDAPLGGAQMHDANAQVPASAPAQFVKIAAHTGM